MTHKTYNYWQAALFYVVANLIAGYGVTLFVDIKAVYSALTLPSWAPPVWVFGAVWTLNNLLVLIGNVWTLNAPKSNARTMLIRVQLLSWLNYMLFQWVSFGTQIPALFFWPSLSMLVLTVVSMYYAYKLDTASVSFVSKVSTGRSVMLTFVTLLVWLCVASALGYFIMMNN